MIGAAAGAAGGAGASAGASAGAAAGAKVGASGMNFMGGGGGGSSGPKYQDPGMNSGMFTTLAAQAQSLQKSDKGFFGHMTVDSCRKYVKIIGRGC